MAGCVHPQRSAGRRLHLTGDVISIFESSENFNTAMVVGLSNLGQAYFARRAIEQPCAQSLFQCLDVIAHLSRRHVEPSAGGRKSVGIDHLDERRQTRKSIHEFLQLRRHAE